MKMDIDRIKNQKIEEIKKTGVNQTPENIDENVEKAVAFKIDDEKAEVLSIGIGNFAKQIKKEAEEHNVPVYENKELTEKLISFDINASLPPSLYDLLVAFINFVSYVERDIYKKK